MSGPVKMVRRLRQEKREIKRELRGKDGKRETRGHGGTLVLEVEVESAMVTNGVRG
jgi:hypothetical protein